MLSQQTQSASKKPRLSLQINTSSVPTSGALKGYPVNPSDPTAFNTLSNAYVTAVERLSALSESTTATTAINALQAFSLESPAENRDVKPRVFTPHVASYPSTPLTAHSTSPPPIEFNYPSTMTATPPLSAGTTRSNSSKVFTFSPSDISCRRGPQPFGSPPESCTPRQSVAPGHDTQPPYTHPRSLRSILRNSPLPPTTAIPLQSPRRQSLRLQEKAAKKVGYNNPLTQEIITNKYANSHIDLLTEDVSPSSPPWPAEPGNARGQAVGSFEDGPCRTARLWPESLSPAGTDGAHKRKRTGMQRQWVWTIDQDDDEDAVGGAGAPAGASTRATGVLEDMHLETPTPSFQSASSVAASAGGSV